MRWAERQARPPKAYGYPWLRLTLSRAQRVSALVSLALGAVCGYVYFIIYPHTGDVAPDSRLGIAFAVAGTGLLALVALGYVVRKRVRRHWKSRLHTALAWHMALGLLGFVLILMHAAGNFNPRTGTYALYGLIAEVVSGIIGRVLDRLAPRLAAGAALHVVNAEEAHESDMEASRPHARGAARSAPPVRQRPPARVPSRGSIPWDLAYYDLDPEIEQIPALLQRAAPDEAGLYAHLRRKATHTARLVLRRERAAGYRQAAVMQNAMRGQQFSTELVRAWRRLHAAISVIALALLAWHIEFAVTLWLHAHGH